MLLVAVGASAVIVALCFLLMMIGKSGPCSPGDLPAKIGFTILMLPGFLVVTCTSVLGTDHIAGSILDNWAVVVVLDVMAYTAIIYVLIFSVMAIVRVTRQRKAGGQPQRRPDNS